MKQFDHLIHLYSSMGGVPAQTQLEQFSTHTWLPNVDIFEQRGCIVLVAELPGIERDSLEVTFDKGMLMISGVREKLLPKDTKRVHQMEIPYGPFKRYARLPANVAVDQIKAAYRNGFLTVTIPKKGLHDR